MCEKCKEFFSKYRCNSPGECDCPRCQGLCVDFDYDPELSDDRIVGFSDENGEQHYTKRTNLRK
jgi:predicted methyltransferase